MFGSEPKAILAYPGVPRRVDADGMRDQALLDREDRMSMAVGLEVRVPFCDHRLVEYAYNTPWSVKTFDGREKSLLRAATADLLPKSIVDRVKSPYPTAQDPAYERVLRAEMGDVLANPNSPALASSTPRSEPPAGSANASDWKRHWD